MSDRLREDAKVKFTTHTKVPASAPPSPKQQEATMSKQPEALRLAEYMDAPLNDPRDVADAAAACLRRQHEEINQLRAERDALRELLARICNPGTRTSLQILADWNAALAALKETQR